MVDFDGKFNKASKSLGNQCSVALGVSRVFSRDGQIMKALT